MLYQKEYTEIFYIYISDLTLGTGKCAYCSTKRESLANKTNMAVSLWVGRYRWDIESPTST